MRNLLRNFLYHFFSKISPRKFYLHARIWLLGKSYRFSFRKNSFLITTDTLAGCKQVAELISVYLTTKRAFYLIRAGVEKCLNHSLSSIGRIEAIWLTEYFREMVIFLILIRVAQEYACKATFFLFSYLKILL